MVTSLPMYFESYFSTKYLAIGEMKSITKPTIITNKPNRTKSNLLNFCIQGIKGGAKAR
jgi:hypothetical protein